MSTHTIQERDVKAVNKRMKTSGLAVQIGSFVLGFGVGAAVAVYTGVPMTVAAIQSVFFGLATLAAALFITSISRQATVEHVKNEKGIGETND